MAQYIYLIAATLGMLTVLMTSQRGSERTQRTEMFNEVSTQLTNAAAEVMETVGRAYFDQYNYQYKDAVYVTDVTGPLAYCGRVEAGAESAKLVANADIGTTVTRTGYSDPVRCSTIGGCRWIEGFDDVRPGTIESGNADTTLVRGGFRVNIEVDVTYADTTTYAASTAQSFAKLVTVTAHTPDVYLGDDPSDFSKQLQLKIARVFTYACPTKAGEMPFPSGSDTCASIGASPPACAVDNGA